MFNGTDRSNKETNNKMPRGKLRELLNNYLTYNHKFSGVFNQAEIMTELNEILIPKKMRECCELYFKISSNYSML